MGVLDVNEEGTEGGAATAVVMTLGGGPPAMFINRPFFFTIMDNETKTIIFMGSVADP